MLFVLLKPSSYEIMLDIVNNNLTKRIVSIYFVILKAIKMLYNYIHIIINLYLFKFYL